ncbi:DUF6340 family protein [Bacteroides sp. OttesenSCG-928-J23]|nr:DUF6340 family protein [Bacteroides sp. OttesenSCG-928-N06]MDL2247278.1 DUF6340 family protein [Bacteroides sp. OttesenSCG-928-J23]MDL2299384.1 DUF6340 family protein [Bacteroides sp. OttesenSCG-928-E20]MDL2306001.1 DUF6340 family protein [Bacteroides sp. OttesenSCG-928-D19]
MKNLYYIFILGCMLTIASCQTLEVISIDYLMPADLNFPPEIKQVGIVNNVHTNTPGNYQILAGDTIKRVYEIARKVNFYDGDAKLTTESLAEAIAEANYFDAVVVSDSALRANDHIARQNTLSQQEVNELTMELDVDMIIALESIQIKTIHTVTYAEGGGYLGIVDAKIYPGLTLYLPNRSAPLAHINAVDSIFWEDLFTSQIRAQTMVTTKEELIKETSIYAGGIPVKHLLPYWQTYERVMYNTNKAAMRDAFILAKQGSWDKALALWQSVYQSKKKKDQMCAAFNIGLYYEVNDNIDEAITWTQKAVDLAREIDKITDTNNIKISFETSGNINYRVAAYYLEKLRQRKEELNKLSMQMRRFENDFK